MLAAADHAARYTEQNVYDCEWTENAPTGISWLNLLTSQSIPEETDGIDSSCASSRHQSNCSSSSSVESCYVVLEIQRPRLADNAASKVEEVNAHNSEEKEADDNDDDDEEEEIQEVIEEFHFAQTNVDSHRIEHEQTVASMNIQVRSSRECPLLHRLLQMPKIECAVEHLQEYAPAMEDHVQITEVSIEQAPHDLPVPRAKVLNKFTKRLPAVPSRSTHDSDFSSSSDDELANITKLKTIRKVNEYHPTVISAVGSEQHSTPHRQFTMEESDSPRCSTTSLDSIEKKSTLPPTYPTRAKTTFSHLSAQRVANPVQSKRPPVPVRTANLTRTFAFDRACMEKYGSASPSNHECAEQTPVRSKEIKSPLTIIEPK